MKKIDRRKTYICVLDTETCPIAKDEKVDPKNMLVYDIGYQIIDKKGNIYKQRSFIVNEIFFGEYEKMLSSYYANKLPQYFQDLGNGTRQRKNFKDIMNIFKEDLKEYDCKIVCAHNAYFDYQSLKTTINYLNYEKAYFFPYDIEFWDSMKMARSTICKNKTYKYYTTNGRKSATAENLYKYISHNENFVERHTGLEDVLIESIILVKCLSYHKKMNKRLFANK